MINTLKGTFVFIYASNRHTNSMLAIRISDFIGMKAVLQVGVFIRYKKVGLLSRLYCAAQRLYKLLLIRSAAAAIAIAVASIYYMHSPHACINYLPVLSNSILAKQACYISLWSTYPILVDLISIPGSQACMGKIFFVLQY